LLSDNKFQDFSGDLRVQRKYWIPVSPFAKASSFADPPCAKAPEDMGFGGQVGGQVHRNDDRGWIPVEIYPERGRRAGMTIGSIYGLRFWLLPSPESCIYNFQLIKGMDK